MSKNKELKVQFNIDTGVHTAILKCTASKSGVTKFEIKREPDDKKFSVVKELIYDNGNIGYKLKGEACYFTFEKKTDYDDFVDNWIPSTILDALRDQIGKLADIKEHLKNPSKGSDTRKTSLVPVKLMEQLAPLSDSSSNDVRPKKIKISGNFATSLPVSSSSSTTAPVIYTTSINKKEPSSLSNNSDGSKSFEPISFSSSPLPISSPASHHHATPTTDAIRVARFVKFVSYLQADREVIKAWIEKILNRKFNEELAARFNDVVCVKIFKGAFILLNEEFASGAIGKSQVQVFYARILAPIALQLGLDIGTKEVFVKNALNDSPFIASGKQSNMNDRMRSILLPIRTYLNKTIKKSTNNSKFFSVKRTEVFNGKMIGCSDNFYPHKTATLELANKNLAIKVLKLGAEKGFLSDMLSTNFEREKNNLPLHKEIEATLPPIKAEPNAVFFDRLTQSRLQVLSLDFTSPLNGVEEFMTWSIMLRCEAVKHLDKSFKPVENLNKLKSMLLNGESVTLKDFQNALDGFVGIDVFCNSALFQHVYSPALPAHVTNEENEEVGQEGNVSSYSKRKGKPAEAPLHSFQYSIARLRRITFTAYQLREKRQDLCNIQLKYHLLNDEGETRKRVNMICDKLDEKGENLDCTFQNDFTEAYEELDSNESEDSDTSEDTD